MEHEAASPADAAADTASGASAPAVPTSTTVDAEEEARLSQVRIDGLHRQCTKKDLLQRLEYHLDVKNIRRAKKQNGHDFAFVYFNTSAARYAAESIIEGHKWKGFTLHVVQATPLSQERFQKRERRDESGNGNDNCGKKRRDDGDASGTKLRSAADVVTPLHEVSYPEQLTRKRQGLLEALRRLPAEMNAASRSVPEAQKYAFRKLPWLESSFVKAHEGSPVPLAEVIPANLMRGYRNKCEFSFGRDEHGEPCLGFQLGRIAVLGPVVGPPDDCPNVRARLPVHPRLRTQPLHHIWPPCRQLPCGFRARPHAANEEVASL